MVSLDMDGPFALSREGIARAVKNNMPGNFALGHMIEGKQFVVRFVDRADTSLHDSLLDALSKAGKGSGLFGKLFGSRPALSVFKFSYAADAKAAFAKHCRNFHNFGGTEKLDNASHPKPPKDSNLTCDFCR